MFWNVSVTNVKQREKKVLKVIKEMYFLIIWRCFDFKYQMLNLEKKILMVNKFEY